MAGQPIAIKNKRVRTVRPHEDDNRQLLQPVSGGVEGDLEVEKNKSDGDMSEDGDKDVMQRLDDKYQEVKGKVEE